MRYCIECLIIKQKKFQFNMMEQKAWNIFKDNNFMKVNPWCTLSSLPFLSFFNITRISRIKRISLPCAFRVLLLFYFLIEGSLNRYAKSGKYCADAWTFAAHFCSLYTHQRFLICIEVKRHNFLRNINSLTIVNIILITHQKMNQFNHPQL